MMAHLSVLELLGETEAFPSKVTEEAVVPNEASTQYQRAYRTGEYECQKKAEINPKGSLWYNKA